MLTFFYLELIKILHLRRLRVCVFYRCSCRILCYVRDLMSRVCSNMRMSCVCVDAISIIASPEEVFSRGICHNLECTTLAERMILAHAHVLCIVCTHCWFSCINSYRQIMSLDTLSRTYPTDPKQSIVIPTVHSDPTKNTQQGTYGRWRIWRIA